MKNMYHFFLCLIGLIVFSTCNKKEGSTTQGQGKQSTETVFTLVPNSQSNITFKNEIKEDLKLNFINFPYIYNGGGVAIGDINNDGLPDIYFSSNQGANKLYLNEGGLKFKDITKSANLEDQGGWTNGVSMVDINGDGFLDIYICKAGILASDEQRKNKLFINNGKNQFIDLAAKYGLDDSAYSTQSYFFDYDKDGDLDMYLVNHRVDFRNNGKIDSDIQRNVSPMTSDKLYRNDIGKFTLVSDQLGMTNKTWGLSASIADFNEDGWLDIYVCNDYLEPDHLFINDQKGGFQDRILTHMDHISFYSMGSDAADINNDAKPDLLVLDMVSEDHVRAKRNMASMNTQSFNSMVSVGYHHQYMANMFFLNQGQGVFSEVAHFAGISKTDWSWGPLIADFNNDGLKDIFVSNGIKRDVTDNDFRRNLMAKNKAGQAMTMAQVFEMAPSQKIRNYLFKNMGESQFANVTHGWGIKETYNSNGVAYADLDRDGDLDLVVNNMEDLASLYENKHQGNFVQIQLKGGKYNSSGLGAEVFVETEKSTQYIQHFLNRGYLSSVDGMIHFGLGADTEIKEIRVLWPNGKMEKKLKPSANQIHQFDFKNAMEDIVKNKDETVFERIDPKALNLGFLHKENVYDDFEKEILLPQKQSTLGPQITKGDVNGDGLEDLFISGAKDESAVLFIQNKEGFVRSQESFWEKEKSFEDLGAVFFDIDGDKDQDLYVVSGGNEAVEKKSMLQDRIYINDGKGNFSQDLSRIPIVQNSGFAVTAGDFDQDGWTDIFVGGKVVPGKYPTTPASYLLKNDKGTLKKVPKETAPDLEKVGMVTDAVFCDYDQDKDLDLVVVGEWMPIVFFENKEGKLEKRDHGLGKLKGWWYSIEAIDIDQDQDIDFVVGNLGLNNKFGAKLEKPFHVYCNDFDDNGSLDIVLGKESKGTVLPVRGRECSSQQMPFIKQKFPTFQSFAEADLTGIYGKQKIKEAQHFEATSFESIVLLNEGNQEFKLSSLPAIAQHGPTLTTQVMDVDQDGHLDIIGAGGIYNTEVETIRYDGSKGYVLYGTGNGEFKPKENENLLIKGNTKDMTSITVNGKVYLIFVKNEGEMEILRVKPIKTKVTG